MDWAVFLTLYLTHTNCIGNVFVPFKSKPMGMPIICLFVLFLYYLGKFFYFGDFFTSSHPFYFGNFYFAAFLTLATSFDFGGLFTLATFLPWQLF
jgi:hypothetical protein